MVNRRLDLLILKNTEWLRSQRLIKSVDEIAEDLGAHYHSVAFACRVFSKEEQKTFVWKRQSTKLK